MEEMQAELAELEQRFEFLDSQLSELNKFESDIEKIHNSENKEMLAPIGKGIFVKAEMRERRFFVDVGAGVVLEKDITDTKRIIREQIVHLLAVREEMIKQINYYQNALRN